MKNDSWQIPIGLGCIFLGILIILLFKGQLHEGFPLSLRSNTQLTTLIKGLETERDKLQKELVEQRKQLAKFENQNLASDAFQKEMERIKMMSGILPVKGPGLTVRISDSVRTPKKNEDPYYFLVHDVEVLAIVNELWAAGTEAISINENRVITSTSIRCAGPIILVGSARLTPPYIIKAIGEPATLESSLRMKGGVLDSLALFINNGVTFVIKREENLYIPEYKGSITFQYAKPVKEQ